jgi:hypothetical protein
MQKTNKILKSTNTEKIYCYDSEIYVKPIICKICQCKFNNKTLSIHIKTETHKLAVQLHSISVEPIEDIKKTILEYKMVQKYMKRKNEDTLSTTSTLENNNDLVLSEENNDSKQDFNSNTSITIEKIRHKTDVYERELAHRAERYEKTKGISKLVNAIQNSTTRLTNLQKNKFHYLLKKYPENELLLSIKHLVPLLTITYVKEPKIKQVKEPKIKQTKKKSKSIENVDEIASIVSKVSYPIIIYDNMQTKL